MPERLTSFKREFLGTWDLEKFFIDTGFYDLLPMALDMADNLGYGHAEVIEAVCKVSDKYCQYPPIRNRIAWFRVVFEEKLREARSDILSFNARVKRFEK